MEREVNSMSTLYIEKVRDLFKSQIGKQIFNYTVPDLWNCFDYDPKKIKRTPRNELMVDPYDFYQSLIDSYILPKKKKNIDYLNSIAQIENRKPKKGSYIPGDWIKESILYSTMI